MIYRTEYDKFESSLTNLTDWSVKLINDHINVTMMRDNENRGTNITITTEGRIEINIEYLEWLYAKSRERKKQNNGLLDTRSAIELVIRDAGGEKMLKEIFLKEHAQKTIDKLAKLDPTIEQTFRQDYHAGLQALSVLLADLEGYD